MVFITSGPAAETVCGEAGEEGVLAENRVHCQLDFRLRFLNRSWNVDMKQLKEPYLQPLKEETSIHMLKSIVEPQVTGLFVRCTQVFLVKEGKNIQEKQILIPQETKQNKSFLSRNTQHQRTRFKTKSFKKRDDEI